MKQYKKPEILAPAGNLERLKIAYLYGADAVYIGGQKYGLRASADNFSLHEIKKGADFAHSLDKKLYVALNSFLHDEDFDGFAEYVRFLEQCKIDAVIVSDLGVIRAIQKYTKNLPVHLSTQASCINRWSAKLWKDIGVSRIVFGREISITEAGKIQNICDIEGEMFVHGAMCMAYSGHCTISNFTAGRDSNRGGCIQSCRFDYKQEVNKKSDTLPIISNFMSSKDLNGVRLVNDFVVNNITSLKIEGRMKSPLYVATTTSVYRRAVDAAVSGNLSEELIFNLAEELNKIPNRNYTEASLETPADPSSIYVRSEASEKNSSRKFVGTILDSDTNSTTMRVYAPVKIGDVIEILGFNGSLKPVTVDAMWGIGGELLSESAQDTVINFRSITNIAKNSVVRGGNAN